MRVLKFFLPCLAALLLDGCAGYHLGPVNGVEAGAKTVEVQPFNNQTLQPRFGDDLTQALREQFQADGTYRLATASRGDLVISGTIRHYDRSGLGYLNADASTPQNFRVAATVHVVVRDRATGKAVLDRDVKGHTLVNVGSDFASSERQALPTLATDIAKNIVSLLAEGSW
jgi:uncharacterized protein YgbK (DUF1537 family)